MILLVLDSFDWSLGERLVSNRDMHRKSYLVWTLLRNMYLEEGEGAFLGRFVEIIKKDATNPASFTCS